MIVISGFTLTSRHPQSHTHLFASSRLTSASNPAVDVKSVPYMMERSRTYITSQQYDKIARSNLPRSFD